MTEAMLFVIGFSLMTSVVEISKTGSKKISDKTRASKDYYKRILK